MKNPCIPFALLLTLAGCGGGDPDKTEKERSARAAEIAIPVRVTPASGGTVIEGLSIQGRLEVWRHEILSAQAAGIIREFPNLPDQVVQAGALVLRLDPPLNEAEEVAIATIARDRAKRAVERLEYLTINAPVTVSAHDLETARDALADAEAKIAVYRKKQEQRRLVAPFTGVLVKFQGVIGDTIAEGAKVAELLDSSRYRIRLELPETSLRRLSLGQTVEVRALSDDSKASGTVASIPGAIDAEKGTGQVVIDTTSPPPTWRPGGFATARLVLKESTGDVVLPREKILYEENRPYCWLSETRDGKLVAHRAWVDLGAGDETRLIITKGVQPGDQVIVEGILGISDGVRIEIKKDEAKPTDKAGKK